MGRCLWVNFSGLTKDLTSDILTGKAARRVNNMTIFQEGCLPRELQIPNGTKIVQIV